MRYLQSIDIDELDRSLESFVRVLDSPLFADLESQGYSIEDSLATIGVSLEPETIF